MYSAILSERRVNRMRSVARCSIAHTHNIIYIYQLVQPHAEQFILSLVIAHHFSYPFIFLIFVCSANHNNDEQTKNCFKQHEKKRSQKKGKEIAVGFFIGLQVFGEKITNAVRQESFFFQEGGTNFWADPEKKTHTKNWIEFIADYRCAINYLEFFGVHFSTRFSSVRLSGYTVTIGRPRSPFFRGCECLLLLSISFGN